MVTYYEEHKTLSNGLRNDLVKMILTDAIAEEIELNAKFNEVMTKKITTIFPTENPVSKTTLTHSIYKKKAKNFEYCF